MIDMQKLNKKQFTLIEILVVVAIIMILAALLFPVISQVNKKARVTSCMGNLKQHGAAFIMYRDDNDDEMPGWLSNLSVGYGLEQKVLICSEDTSQGYDGGRPGGDGDTYDAEYYGSDSLTLPDRYPETDDTSRNNGPFILPRTTSITHCSYMYEFAGVECSFSWDPLDPSGSWGDMKERQMVEKDAQGELEYSPDYFPAVRCFYHWGGLWGKDEYILNASYAGGYFASKMHWEKGVYK